MKEIEVERLVHDARSQLKVLEFRQSTLAEYERLVFSPIQKFFRDHEERFFNTALSADFLTATKRDEELGIIPPKASRLRERGIQLMVELYLTGSFTWRMRSKGHKVAIPECYAAVLEAFSEDAKCRGNRSIDSIVRKYLAYLDSKGIHEAETICVADIREFIVDVACEHRSSMDYVVLAMRHFHRYLKEAGLLRISFESALAAPRVRKRRVLPCITEDEMSLVLKQIDVSSAKGKRDYAILLLGMRGGLRAGDIARLRLADIDWSSNEMRVVQGKTGKPLLLPLTPLVGNAIADYILHGRPKSDSAYVFLRVLAPLQAFSDGQSVSSIFRRYLQKAHIEHVIGDGRTFHGLRRTLGTNLVSNGAPVTTVAQILGHGTLKSTKRYISLDVAGRHPCALDFRNIGGSNDK